MNEFEDLLNSVSQVEPGDVVTAEVLTVDANQANVAISGTGVEGVLTLRELTNDRDADINDLVKPGETLELLVLRQVVGKDTDTVTYLVSKKRLEARKAWDKLVGREEEVVTVKGTRAVKGGLSVEFEGLRGFIPASMLDTRFVRNTERFVGQEFDAKIKEVDAKENRFILSRREVVEAASAAARAEVFGKLNVGDVVTGKVARITSFGAFIDLGGVDGLVHLTELSHERNVSPKSVVSVGDEIEVKVLDLNEEEGVKEEYLFAPDSNQVLTSLVPTYLEAFVYNSLLQSAASELGARMTAMTSATDNAGELIDRLTVHYNKVRQAGITNELTEIVSGANALQ